MWTCLRGHFRVEKITSAEGTHSYLSGKNLISGGLTPSGENPISGVSWPPLSGGNPIIRVCGWITLDGHAVLDGCAALDGRDVLDGCAVLDGRAALDRLVALDGCAVLNGCDALVRST